MITLLNFGDSPFALLFYIICGIAILVLGVNIFAFLLSKAIDRRAAKILRKKR